MTGPAGERATDPAGGPKTGPAGGSCSLAAALDSAVGTRTNSTVCLSSADELAVVVVTVVVAVAVVVVVVGVVLVVVRSARRLWAVRLVRLVASLVANGFAAALVVDL